MCLCYAPVCYVTKRVVVFREGGKRHSQSMLFCSCISLYASLDSVQEECFKQRDAREGGRLVQGTAFQEMQEKLHDSFLLRIMDGAAVSVDCGKRWRREEKGKEEEGEESSIERKAQSSFVPLVYRLAFLSLFFREPLSLSLSSSFSLICC